jgi:glucokinase
MTKPLVIGVDLGATTVKAGVVDSSGIILAQRKVDTLANKGPDVVIGQISIAIQELVDEFPNLPITGIGLGAPGVVSTDGGVVKYPPNFSDWDEIDLGKAIRKEFRLPVRIENDANVAALAESRYGAGKGRKDFLFVIWGTGVGGGIILGGEIVHGQTGGAGEIGHVTIDYNGPECGCGNRGCVEAYVGQRYLSQTARERIAHAGGTSKILELAGGNFDAIEPYIISMAAKEGDRLAHDILVEAGTLLGVGLASVLNVLDLRLVIVGGGISAAEPFVFDAIERSVKSRVLKGSRDSVRVVPARLGNTAGILGAASLVTQGVVA